MTMSNYEELQKSVATSVVWLRSEGLPCPTHNVFCEESWIAAADEARMPVVIPESALECEWRHQWKELLDSLLEVMGTTDMSPWLP